MILTGRGYIEQKVTFYIYFNTSYVLSIKYSDTSWSKSPGAHQKSAGVHGGKKRARKKHARKVGLCAQKARVAFQTGKKFVEFANSN